MFMTTALTKISPSDVFFPKICQQGFRVAEATEWKSRRSRIGPRTAGPRNSCLGPRIFSSVEAASGGSNAARAAAMNRPPKQHEAVRMVGAGSKRLNTMMGSVSPAEVS